MVEHLERPTTLRQVRAVGAARDRVADVLAGRTVWCAMALPGLARAANQLRALLDGAAPGVAAVRLQLTAGEQLRGLAEQLDRRVDPGDIVVAHDALSATAAPAMRERGAHAVWRVLLSRRSRNAEHRALGFLPVFGRLDAYLLGWRERGPGGQITERVAAAMPSAGMIAAKEFAVAPPGEDWRRLVWWMALAEIVRSDREECVGGTLHPRPAVPAR
jgi:hypothetical protein